MANETIGHIKCPIAGDMAEVRKDKRGKLYYVGIAGMIKPNLPTGQAWMAEQAEMFADNTTKPENEPEPESLVNVTEKAAASGREAVGLGSFFSWGDE